MRTQPSEIPLGAGFHYWMACLGGAALLAASGCAQAVPAEPFVIGIVNPAAILDPIITGFQEEMDALGYPQGARVIYRYDGPVARDGMERLVQQYLDEEVDLILAMTTPAAQAAKAGTAGTSMPVLFEVTDPLDAGLIDSFPQPGGNLTGVVTGGSDALRLEWLTRIAPGVRRVYMPYNPSDRSPAGALTQIAAAADKLGVELILREATDADAVRNAIADIPDEADAIFIGPDSLVGSLYPEWIAAAVERRLPLTGSSTAHVQAGMLFSYSYETDAVGRQMARQAALILNGVRPADIPVETSEFYLSLNLDTAARIGVRLPDAFVLQARLVVRK